MSFDGNDNKWSCSKTASMNLQCVGSIVRDIGEPCLRQSPEKRIKMLKEEKWRANFDSDGKVFCFQKALKLIVLGGVDPSIRAEVWEFLLGCYTLGSTTEHRRRLRMARRERYKDLIKQCQKMHSSIGTGSLAYVVGSKVMDVKIDSRDSNKEEEDVRMSGFNDATIEIEASDWSNNCTDVSYACQTESSSDPPYLFTVRGSTDSARYDSSGATFYSGQFNCFSPKEGMEVPVSQNEAETYFDVVTELPESSDSDKIEFGEDRMSTKLKVNISDEDENMYSFQISNNVDLIMESNGSRNDVSCDSSSATEVFDSDTYEKVEQSRNFTHRSELNTVRISDAQETGIMKTTTSETSANEVFDSDTYEKVEQSRNFTHRSELKTMRISDAQETGIMKTTTSERETETNTEGRVSEWLWTLHQIVVDVVRTDSDLEFYEDTKNMARMSDILAVYAWVDPSIGYCQGMSDLLSPFVFLYEDNADAFWCFEMLLRRMRENFQTEGPTGVMKQLESLWRILELTDKETFAHLSLIGAESLHFAFRMLLILFRRELSFSEVLRMWEMIWAADFDESVSQELEKNCLQPLVIQFPRDSSSESGEEIIEGNGISSERGQLQLKNGIVENSVSDNNGIKSAVSHPFCGLTRNFWLRDCMGNSTLVSSTRNCNDELPVFCVAAILIINRNKIIKETRSLFDLIKIFNENMLDISVTRCIHMAIKLRRKYYKVMKQKRRSSRSEQL